jgi:hypothetical protein
MREESVPEKSTVKDMPLVDPQLVLHSLLHIKLVLATKFCEGFGQKSSPFKENVLKIKFCETIILFGPQIRELLHQNYSDLKQLHSFNLMAVFLLFLKS